MRENERNWRENEKKRELEALHAKILFNQEESFFFSQSVQIAYIAIKTSKITKFHELTLLQKV